MPGSDLQLRLGCLMTALYLLLVSLLLFTAFLTAGCHLHTHTQKTTYPAHCAVRPCHSPEPSRPSKIIWSPLNSGKGSSSAAHGKLSSYFMSMKRETCRLCVVIARLFHWCYKVKRLPLTWGGLAFSARTSVFMCLSERGVTKGKGQEANTASPKLTLLTIWSASQNPGGPDCV